MGQRAKIAVLRIIYKLYSPVEKEEEKYAAACNETLRSYNTLILEVHGTWDSGREGGEGRGGGRDVNRRLNFVRRSRQPRRLGFNSVIITSLRVPGSPKVNDDVTRLQTERRDSLVLKLIDRPMFIGERPNFWTAFLWIERRFPRTPRREMKEIRRDGVT